MASDFEINGQVNIDYSAFDKMSKAAERSYRNAIQPFDRMTSKFAQFEQTLNQVSKTSGRTLAELSGFGNLSTDFLVAANAANQLNNSLKSLSGTDKARLRIANQVAAELGGRNYANLSSEIDRRLSPDYRPTRQTVSGGAVIDFSSREKNLAIVASMTAKAAEEDRKFAEAEKRVADQVRFVTTEFDRSQKERQKFMQTAYRQQVMTAFPPIFPDETPIELTATRRLIKQLKLPETFQAADAELLKLVNHMPRIRYALYDVAASTTATSAAFLALGAAPLAFGVNANRAFADVIRTVKLGETGTADYDARLAKLRLQFVELQQTIPESFKELTKIGALGGQLNVATESLANFTKTVAMFSATTNVNIQDAATAFGRLDQLINGINGRYEALGSSILKVGVNSVATESQIIAIAQQIASIANLAKFSADQVIGLSGALASVGTSPELSRGLVTRLFGNIQSAVATGSEALKKFGAVSGQSGEEFSRAWETGAAAQLIRFLKGLNEDGTQAEATLRGLGIASIRDIPAILKLAQNWREVAESLRIARDGFVDNTELQKQYGIISKTVADRIQVLKNNIEALFATLTEGSTSSEGPLANLVSFISDMVRFLTDIARNPLSQWFAGIAAAAAIALGALGLLAAGFVFAAARGTALVQTLFENAVALGIFSKTAELANMSMGQLTGGFIRAALSVKVFRTALISTGVGLAVVAGLTALTAVTTHFGEELKSSGDKARQFFNDIDVSQAIKADTEALKSGATAYKSWSVSQEDSTTSIAARKMALVGMTEAEKELQDELDKTTQYLNAQTVALGENYAQALAQEFGNKVINEKDNPLRALFDDPKLFEAFKATGLTALEVVTTTIRDGLPAAQARISQAFGQLKPLIPDLTGASRGAAQGALERATAGGKIEGASKAFNDLAIATANLTTEQQANIAYQEALGIALQETASDAEIATEKLKEYKDAVADAFLETNTVSDFAESFTQLAEGIAAGGNSFSSFTKAGRTNLSNFQDAVAKSIRAGESLGMSATESVAMLFAALQAQGIDTAKLLAQVANIPGIDASQIQGIISSGIFSDVSAGFVDIANAASDAGDEVGGVAQKVRTLTDYASDLQNVYSRAFDIRFTAQSTLDDITTSFRNIAEATADAVSEIQDLNAEIGKLSADRALKEYFLSVAEAYGDTLRAAQLRAEIAEIDSDLAKKSKDLNKAQDKTNKTLVGSSEAAIENRAEILDLVKSYQDHIDALASSGMSQEQLALTTEQLRQDFIAQATQLGYNADELGIYAAAFDDVAYAINNVPRELTVTVDSNPAVTALNEIRAAADAASGAVSNIDNALPDFDTTPIRKAALQSKIQYLTAYLASLRDSSNWRAGDIILAQLIAAQKDLANGNFAAGGYTGAGGKYQIAGVVHRGEYVVPKEQVNQATGTPYFMQQMPKFFTGGYVGGTSAGSTMMVELSPIDRQLLAQAGNVQLTIDGRVIAGATNSANYVSALRGSN